MDKNKWRVRYSRLVGRHKSKTYPVFGINWVEYFDARSKQSKVAPSLMISKTRKVDVLDIFSYAYVHYKQLVNISSVSSTK